MSVTPARFPFNAYPLALLSAALATGILIQHYVSLPLALALTCAAVCAALSLRYGLRQRQALSTVLICAAFVGTGAALAREDKQNVRPDRLGRLYEDGVIASGDPLEITGVLERAPELAPDGVFYRLRVEKVAVEGQERDASGTVALFASVRDRETREAYEGLELYYGARVRIMTVLDRSERFRNPGVSSLTEFLEHEDIDAMGSIKSPLLVERLGDERVFVPLALLYEWRQRLLAEINATFSHETAGVLNAALLGNRFYLSHETSERFQEGGTFHILVINGLHISFIGAMIWLCVQQLTKRRLWRFVASTAFLWGYAMAIGAAAPVVRASLMFTVAALAPVLFRRARSLNALGAAALVLLVWRPGDLFDPAFQLTVFSVASVVTIAVPLIERMQETGAWRPTRATPYPPLCARWWRTLSEALFWSERGWRREMAQAQYTYRLFKTPLAATLERLRLQGILRSAVGAVIVSTGVQIGLLPFLIIYFHRLSFAALILNIGVGLLMAAQALVGLVAIALAQASHALAVPLVTITETLNWLMVHSVDPFSRAHLASVRLPYYAGAASFIYIAYYAPVAILAVALARWNPLRCAPASGPDRGALSSRRARVAALGLVAIFILVVAHPLSAGRPDGRLRIDHLDVGQGDSALVTMPDGTTLLIDGGGRPRFRRQPSPDEDTEPPIERDTRSIGEAVVSEYLWWRGLDHVDYILATHADADHINGLNDVARNFRVREAIVGREPSNSFEFVKFAATAGGRGVPLRVVARGETLKFGAVTADVLWPPHLDNPDAPSGNNDSIVLRMRFGERVFLLTGDMEREAEASVLYAREDIGSDVVKVAHHGSRTSSIQDFVAASHPRLAIISVGLTSPFGHPRPEVVRRWRAVGAEVLTTGQSGTITVSTDGHDLKVRTFVREGEAPRNWSLCRDDRDISNCM